MVPIASVHNQITGMWGGSGITFACNNFEAAVSYGLLDANTCGTSVYDMEKYTRALNYLAASGSKHNFKEGNSVFVFWSMDGSERAEEIYSGLLDQYNMDEAMEEKSASYLNVSIAESWIETGWIYYLEKLLIVIFESLNWMSERKEELL